MSFFIDSEAFAGDCSTDRRVTSAEDAGQQHDFIDDKARNDLDQSDYIRLDNLEVTPAPDSDEFINYALRSGEVPERTEDNVQSLFVKPSTRSTTSVCYRRRS